jgi:hypothetical protein
MILRATLPKNRDIPGELVALDDGAVIHRCPVLGRSDNARARQEGNPTRNPLLPFGDTPTGLWQCSKRGPVSPASTYGVHPVVVMNPIGGDALRASKRCGIWLHGGAPGRAAVWAYLRPTFGCLRVADDDMRQIWLLAATFGEPETIETLETENV